MYAGLSSSLSSSSPSHCSNHQSLDRPIPCQSTASASSATPTNSTLFIDSLSSSRPSCPRIAHAKSRSVSGQTVFVELLDAQPPTVEELQAFDCFTDPFAPFRASSKTASTPPVTVDTTMPHVTSTSYFNKFIPETANYDSSGPLSPKSPNVPTSPSFFSTGLPFGFQGRRSSSFLRSKSGQIKDKDRHPLSPRLAKVHPSPRRSRSTGGHSLVQAGYTAEDEGGPSSSSFSKINQFPQRPKGPERSVSFADEAIRMQQMKVVAGYQALSEGQKKEIERTFLIHSTRRHSMPAQAVAAGIGAKPSTPTSSVIAPTYPRLQILAQPAVASGFTADDETKSLPSPVEQRRMSYELARAQSAQAERIRSASPSGSNGSVSNNVKKPTFLGLGSAPQTSPSISEAKPSRPSHAKRSLSASFISLGKKVAQLGNSGDSKKDRQSKGSEMMPGFEIVSPRAAYNPTSSSSRPSSPLISSTIHSSLSDGGDAESEEDNVSVHNGLLSPSFVVTNRPNLLRNAKSDDGQRAMSSPKMQLPAGQLPLGAPTSPLARTVVSASTTAPTRASSISPYTSSGSKTGQYNINATIAVRSARSPIRRSTSVSNSNNNSPTRIVQNLARIQDAEREREREEDREGWKNSLRAKTRPRRMSAVDVFDTAPVPADSVESAAVNLMEDAPATVTEAEDQVVQEEEHAKEEEEAKEEEDEDEEDVPSAEEPLSPFTSPPLSPGELDFTKKPVISPNYGSSDVLSPLSGSFGDTSFAAGRPRTTSYSSLLSTSRPTTPSHVNGQRVQHPGQASSPTPSSRYGIYQRHRPTQSMTALTNAVPSFTSLIDNSCSVATSTHAKFAAALSAACSPASSPRSGSRNLAATSQPSYQSYQGVVIIDRKDYRKRMANMNLDESAVEDDEEEEEVENTSSGSDLSARNAARHQAQNGRLPKLSYGTASSAETDNERSVSSSHDEETEHESDSLPSDIYTTHSASQEKKNLKPETRSSHNHQPRRDPRYHSQGFGVSKNGGIQPAYHSAPSAIESIGNGASSTSALFLQNTYGIGGPIVPASKAALRRALNSSSESQITVMSQDTAEDSRSRTNSEEVFGGVAVW